MTDIHHSRILILDFGSQYTQLIARRVREIGVYCELMPFDVASEAIAGFKAQGIILSGGPESVNSAPDFKIPDIVFQLKVPLLGICYGMQSMANQLGGKVAAGEKREFGHTRIVQNKTSRLFAGIPAELDVWMSHGDQVIQLPTGFTAIAASANAPIAAFGHESKSYYALQFHPEVTHTQFGLELLSNFVLDICGCEALWTPSNIVSDAIEQIRDKVGQDEVILGLSGGVDSSVVAALLHEAIGSQLTCVFVDTGLLRLHEGDPVS